MCKRTGSTVARHPERVEDDSAKYPQSWNYLREVHASHCESTRTPGEFWPNKRRLLGTANDAILLGEIIPEISFDSFSIKLLSFAFVTVLIAIFLAVYP